MKSKVEQVEGKTRSKPAQKGEASLPPPLPVAPRPDQIEAARLLAAKAQFPSPFRSARQADRQIAAQIATQIANESAIVPTRLRSAAKTATNEAASRVSPPTTGRPVPAAHSPTAATVAPTELQTVTQTDTEWPSNPATQLRRTQEAHDRPPPQPPFAPSATASDSAPPELPLPAYDAPAAPPLDTAAIASSVGDYAPWSDLPRHRDFTRSSHRVSIGYVAAWAVIAVGALGYLFGSLGVQTISTGPSGGAGTAAVVAAHDDAFEATPSSANPFDTSAPPKLAQRLEEKKRSLADIVDQLAQLPDDEAEGEVDNAAQSSPVVSPPAPTVAMLNAAGSSPAGKGMSSVPANGSITAADETSANTAETASAAVAGVASAQAEPKRSAAPLAVSVLNAPRTVRSIPVVRKTPPVATIPAASSAIAARLVEATADSASVIAPPLPGRIPTEIRQRAIAEARQKAARIAAAKRAAAERTRLAAANTAANTLGQPIGGFETASIRRAPETTGSTTPTLAGSTAPPMGVRLSSASSVDALRMQWTMLRAKYQRHLQGLNARYIRSASAPGEQKYVLVAGPLQGAMQALELCQDVSTSGTPCVVGNYVGNAL